MTTSFCIDFLKIDPGNKEEKKKRIGVHIMFSLLMIFVVVLFRELNNSSVISSLFKAVGYTYGPLLGLFTFGFGYKFGFEILLLNGFLCYLGLLFIRAKRHKLVPVNTLKV